MFSAAGFISTISRLSSRRMTPELRLSRIFRAFFRSVPPPEPPSLI
jgi:hypothetical protein